MTPPRHESADVARWDLVTHDGRFIDLELDKRSGEFRLCTIRYDEDVDDWRIVREFKGAGARMAARIARVALSDGTPAVLPHM